MSERRWLILLIIPLVLLTSYSTTYTPASHTSGRPTILQVQRVNLITENHYLPFSPRTVTNQQSVQRLYKAALALPHFPLGPMSCPLDVGLGYHLDFFQKHLFLQEINVDMGGCRAVHLGKKDTRIYHDAFRQLLAQTIGVSENDLNAGPLFSCTPQSPCLSAHP